ncbi:glycosyltransferase family 4 protein [Candidatus Woesebacteria bacterium]|nr:glycosyltransferase family 4 protein [Candidatus Woesebacteria bacterium]
MNILIDTTPLSNGSAIRGIGRYTAELLRALINNPASHRIYTPDTVENQGVDIVHYPFFDLFFPTLPIGKRARTIVTIHDVIPLLFPKHYPRGIKGTLNFWKQKFALRSVSHIITDSESSKRDIVDHLHVRSDKISVVYLAASPDIKKPSQGILDSVRKKYSLPRNFALFVGDINYNKNLPFLLNVISKIPKLTLVLVGRAMNNQAIPEGKAIHHTIAKLGLEKRVLIIDTLGGDSVEELSSIYSLASFYIQPSLYEGFGLPILEAMQCKTPIVCSRAGSLPEVAGEAAVYFHPMEVDDCRQAIEKVLRYSDKQLQSMVKKGVEQAARFSWEKTAKETIKVYEKVGSSV